MPENRPVIDAILARRSVAPRRLVPPGPSGSELRTMVEAAVAAPDHGRLRHWRFVLIPDDRRAALANAFAEAARESDPEIKPEMVEREAEKAHHGPALLAVIVRVKGDHPFAPVNEQWASAGAAIQNFLLAAEAAGYRAMIVSGKKVETQRLRRAFSLGEDEHLIGFIAVGKAMAEPAPIERPTAEDHLSVWAGE
jgi:nitroreductase